MLWVAVALAGTMLWFLPGLLEQFETPKVEVVRACGLGALALGLIAGRAGRPGRWVALDRAVALWLAVEVVTTVLSVSPRVSLLGETRQREGLLTSAGLAGLYFAARDAFARPGRVRIFLDLTLALATLVGLYAVAQVLGQDPFRWQRQAVYAGVYVRPFATLGHPNLLGLLCAAVASLATGLAIAGPGGPRRWLTAAAALLLAVVTVLTLSRAAWIGLALGVVVAIAIALRERGAARLTGRALGLAALALAVLTVLVVVTGGGALVARRFEELLAGGGGSGSSRLEIWRTALAAWRDRPLTGHGPDLFEMVFTRFQTASYWRYEWSGLPFHAHSIYLHTLATRGLLGLLAAATWAAALAAAAAAVWRRRAEVAPADVVPAAAGLLAAAAAAGAFGALGIAGALLVVTVSAALASVAEARPAPVPAAPGPGGRARGSRRATPPAGKAARARTGVRRIVARLAAAAVVLAAAFWGFTGLRASRAAAAAQSLMTRAPDRASAASRYALALSPHEDRLWRMHAVTVLWLTTMEDPPPGALDEAEAAARRAVALAPARAENRIILARALATREARGDTAARAAAEAEFRRSFALAPMDGLSLMEYADHEALVGRVASALAAARRVLALYPDEGAAWSVLARAWLAAGAPDSARAAYDRALSAGWRDEGQRRATEAERDDLGPPPSGR